MQKCPILPVVSLLQDGTIKDPLPYFLGFSWRGEKKLLEAGADGTLQAVVRAADGKLIESKPVRSSTHLSEDWQQEMLLELGDTIQIWQVVVLIAAGWQVKCARGRDRKNWILNTASVMARFGQLWMDNHRKCFPARFPSGIITLPELGQLFKLPDGIARRAVRKGVIPSACLQPKGKRLVIRLCPEFYWWIVCQDAMTHGATLAKQLPYKALPLTRESLLSNCDKEEIHLAKKDVLRVGNKVALVSRETLQEASSSQKPHKLWTKTLQELSKSVLTKKGGSDHFEVAAAIQQLLRRADRLKRERRISKSAVAKLMGTSRQTFYRKGYASIYDKLQGRRPQTYLSAVNENALGKAEDLEEQGIRLATEREAQKPIAYPIPKEHAFTVALPHMTVVVAYENGDVPVSELRDYVTSLPIDEMWALEEALKNKGYDEAKLRNFGFSRTQSRNKSKTPKD